MRNISGRYRTLWTEKRGNKNTDKRSSDRDAEEGCPPFILKFGKFENIAVMLAQWNLLVVHPGS